MQKISTYPRLNPFASENRNTSRLYGGDKKGDSCAPITLNPRPLWVRPNTRRSGIENADPSRVLWVGAVFFPVGFHPASRGTTVGLLVRGADDIPPEIECLPIVSQ